jgi:transcriptional regulator with XRE-family HTH domain
LKRTALGAYEEGRAEPRLAALVRLAHILNVSLDALVLGGTENRMEQDVRVLPIPVDRDTEFERITAVGAKAAAGYAAGLGDPEWIAQLPHFSLPLPEVPQDRTLRFFQIEGDSMLPLRSGTWVLTEFVERLDQLGTGKPHILSTREDGLLFKKVESLPENQGLLQLISTNSTFSPFTYPIENIREAWKAIGWFSTDWPEAAE